MALLSLRATELLDRFASPDPTPGGGSASALAGATAAALVTMVCRMSKTRTGDPAERARLEAALADARDVPLRTAEMCRVVLGAAQAAAENGNPNAVSDARTAAALAWAGLRGAAENVRINLGPGGASALRDHIDGIERQADASLAALGLAPAGPAPAGDR